MDDKSATNDDNITYIIHERYFATPGKELQKIIF